MHALQQHPIFSSPISGTTRYHNFSSAVPFTFLSLLFFFFLFNLGFTGFYFCTFFP
jgi:hypothetical protein